jgi:hypothetical protein
MSTENVSPKPPIKNPHWSKGCLRPNSPFTIGTGSPIQTGNIGVNDTSINSNESGSNRTLKRFMTIKKSKANEFLKRGFNKSFKKNKRIISVFSLLVETSGGDSLLLSVIEAYCNSGTAITNLNNLISKARHSIQGNADHNSPTTSFDM